MGREFKLKIPELDKTAWEDLNHKRLSTNEHLPIQVNLAIAERLEALVVVLENIEDKLGEISWATGYRA